MELLENIGLSPLNGEVAGRGLGRSGPAHDFFAEGAGKVVSRIACCRSLDRTFDNIITPITSLTRIWQPEEGSRRRASPLTTTLPV